MDADRVASAVRHPDLKETDAVTAPKSVTLTGPELAQLRRSLLTVAHQAEALRGGVPVERVTRRLEEAVAGLRYLLDRVEARRDVH
jgi:hypothetical protein